MSFSKARAHLPCPWTAYCKVDGKTVALGTYATADEAHAARLAWEATGVVPPPTARLRSNNTSGVRGVYRQGKAGKPWLARAVVDKKFVYLGYYATIEEAADARRAFDATEGVT